MSGGSEGIDHNAPEPRTDAITRAGQDKQIYLNVSGRHVDQRLLSPACR